MKSTLLKLQNCSFEGRKNCYAWTENGNLLGLPPRLCRSTCAFLLVWKSPSVINVKLASFPRNQPNLTDPFLGFTPLLLPENLNQAWFSPTPLRPSARSLVHCKQAVLGGNLQIILSYTSNVGNKITKSLQPQFRPHELDSLAFSSAKAATF